METKYEREKRIRNLFEDHWTDYTMYGKGSKIKDPNIKAHCFEAFKGGYKEGNDDRGFE